jgi:hypothetical protein
LSYVLLPHHLLKADGPVFPGRHSKVAPARFPRFCRLNVRNITCPLLTFRRASGRAGGQTKPVLRCFFAKPKKEP